MFNTARQIGGVLGGAAIGVLLQARLTVSLHAAAVASAGALPVQFREAFVAGMAVLALGALSCLAIARRPARPAPAAPREDAVPAA